jgi:Tfp pilus assembly protein PilO
MRGNPKSNPLAIAGKAIVDEALRRGSIVSFGLSAVVCIGLGYAAFTYGLAGWLDSTDKYRGEVEAKERENARTEQMLAGEEQFLARFNKIVELYQEAKPLLPEETEVSEVLGQVETAAQRNGVTLTGLQAVKASAKSTSSDKLYEREIPALVSGPYTQVMQFFADVSRMPRILVVRDYSVVSLKNSVSAGFTLFAYHAPPPSEKPQAPEPAKKK